MSENEKYMREALKLADCAAEIGEAPIGCVSWDNTSDGNVGGCFETVEINGTELWLNTYILNDATGEINKVDEVSFTKKTGENKITFEGDNTTSEMDYTLSLVPSFFGLAKYAITKWLPEFFKMLPALLESVIVEDTF